MSAQSLRQTDLRCRQLYKSPLLVLLHEITRQQPDRLAQGDVGPVHTPVIFTVVQEPCRSVVAEFLGRTAVTAEELQRCCSGHVRPARIQALVLFARGRDVVPQGGVPGEVEVEEGGRPEGAILQHGLVQVGVEADAVGGVL